MGEGNVEDWVHAHAHGVLLTIEVLWVGGFLAVFVVYFFVWRWFKKQPILLPAPLVLVFLSRRVAPRPVLSCPAFVIVNAPLNRPSKPCPSTVPAPPLTAATWPGPAPCGARPA